MIISLSALFDQALFTNISKDAKHSFKSNFIFLNMPSFLSEVTMVGLKPHERQLYPNMSINALALLKASHSASSLTFHF